MLVKQRILTQPEYLLILTVEELTVVRHTVMAFDTRAGELHPQRCLVFMDITFKGVVWFLDCFCHMFASTERL